MIFHNLINELQGVYQKTTLLTVATTQDVMVIWFDSVVAPTILLLGFGVGLFLGVIRGKMTFFRKNPVTGKWTKKSSWAAYLMWIAVFIRPGPKLKSFPPST
ncbi:hypothetical protein [Brevibacillus sp. SIMBA_040]|uniref:hypothetical protein n=1 Tax=Brevibacillus sp. SIMBA_040 TaxID=3085781 RepID=UPI00397985BA